MSEAEIEELVGRYPLPASVPDATLNRSELAEFFGVSPLTITSWMGQGMPVQQEGDQGKPYEFRAAACWAWRQARSAADEARSAEARAAISSMRLELIGGGTGDSIEALDPKARREIYAMQTEHERWAAQRKQLMPRAEVADMFEALLMLVRDALEAAPDRVERVQAMPPIPTWNRPMTTSLRWAGRSGAPAQAAANTSNTTGATIARRRMSTRKTAATRSPSSGLWASPLAGVKARKGTTARATRSGNSTEMRPTSPGMRTRRTKARCVCITHIGLSKGREGRLGHEVVHRVAA